MKTEAPFPSGIRYRDDLQAWWPDYDHAPAKCLQFVKKGIPAIDVAVRYCRKRREVVQAGGHAGFWPLALSRLFEHVHAFEPERALFDCMTRNCQADNVTMYPDGLGAAPARVKFLAANSAGSWRVDPQGGHEINIVPVDSLGLQRCDAIMLDVEGYEVEVLRGAAETIARTSPVILVELLPRSAAAIDKHLAGLGYTMRARFGRDGIYARGSA